MNTNQTLPLAAQRLPWREKISYGIAGRRATAMTFAAATFSQKLDTALTAAVMGWVFTALGYVANATQTAKSQTGIVLLISFIPAAFAFLAVAVMMFYMLDNKQLAQIQIELAASKAALKAAL